MLLSVPSYNDIALCLKYVLIDSLLFLHLLLLSLVRLNLLLNLHIEIWLLLQGGSLSLVCATLVSVWGRIFFLGWNIKNWGGSFLEGWFFIRLLALFSTSHALHNQLKLLITIFLFRKTLIFLINFRSYRATTDLFNPKIFFILFFFIFFNFLRRVHGI